MKRIDLISTIEIPEDQEKIITDALDHYESKFSEIVDMLRDIDIHTLDRVEDALRVAEQACSDIY